jgi:hypothetical protein
VNAHRSGLGWTAGTFTRASARCGAFVLLGLILVSAANRTEAEVSVPGVPVGLDPPVVDGFIYESSEYSGAAKLVMTYDDPSDPNGSPAYLIHDDNDLYVAIKGVRAGIFGDAGTFSASHVSVFLDPSLARPVAATASQLQLQIDVGTGAVHWLCGDGAGGYQATGAPDSSQWQVASRSCDDDVLFNWCVEVRFSKDLLGDWSTKDGLAIGHCAGGADNTCNGYMTLMGASAAAPNTWAILDYGVSPNSAFAQLAGRIFDTWYAGMAIPRPVQGATVTLLVGNPPEVFAEKTTEENGVFDFLQHVPAGVDLTLSVNGGPFWRWSLDAVVDGPGPSASAVATNRVTFPGCASDSTCVYPVVTFRPEVDPGVAMIEEIDPASAAGAVLLAEPDVVSCPELVTLRGQNLHEGLDVASLRLKPPLWDVCEPNGPEGFCPDMADWPSCPAQIVDRDRDRTWIKVEMPTVPASWIGKKVWWVVENSWTLQEYVYFPRIDRQAPETTQSFTVTEPAPYPGLYEFGFHNPGTTWPHLYEFLGSYGTSAYCCVGLLDWCAFYTPDPLYWIVAYPCYEIYMAIVDGSCVGMSATSLLMYEGDLQPETLDPSIHYPAGFTQDPGESQWYTPFLGVAFGPPWPANLKAEIRKNHGAQTSMEAIDVVLVYWLGSPLKLAFDALEETPLGSVLSMPGVGHAVTPYSLVGNELLIYDSNHPPTISNVSGRPCLQASEQSVALDRDAGTYTHEKGSGTVLVPFPLDLWRGTRTAPGILNMNTLYSVICGSGGQAVDVLYATPDGGRWGWQDDGTFVESLPGLVPLPPVNRAGGQLHNMAVALPMAKAAPTATIHAHSVDYLVHAANNGVFLVHPGIPGNAARILRKK